MRGATGWSCASVAASAFLSLAGCGPDDEAGSAEDTESSGSSGSTGDASTSPGTTTTTSSASDGDPSGEPTSEGTTGLDPNNLNCCVPHQTPACNEPAVQACVCGQDAGCCVFAWDGVCTQLAAGQCQAQCVDGTDTAGATTGGMTSECDPVQIELTPENDAVVSGAWQLTMSQAGEGIIAVIDAPAQQGAVTYQPDIPCADTWYVWVRYFDSGTEDSYFVLVDGEPDPIAVFEGDCMPQGGGWDWNLLNWRDPLNDGQCEYTEDPWVFDWDAGVHDIEFTLRESRAIGRIVLTNDEMYTP